ncbi:guanine nucleotide exchange factor MSS4 isoform X2 [Hydra vulgaris]|uniref:Guanine nucleotide exchange factor MSS4 isoform X2 n=1 Tax=Hydra vulgaris TaxID=6087 RepID=A0ABM4DBA7_HYDVU
MTDPAISLGDNSNDKEIVCSFCGSKILKAHACYLLNKSFPLPHMKVKTEDSFNSQVECLSEYWLVNDMMTFENVGFSHNVGTIKYLACADCEIGPIGYHDTQVPNEFYVAVSRVKYI